MTDKVKPKLQVKVKPKLKVKVTGKVEAKDIKQRIRTKSERLEAVKMIIATVGKKTVALSQYTEGINDNYGQVKTYVVFNTVLDFIKDAAGNEARNGGKLVYEDYGHDMSLTIKGDTQCLDLIQKMVVPTDWKQYN